MNIDNDIEKSNNMINIIKKYKDLIRKYIETSEISEMKKNNYDEYIKYMYNKFIEFRSNYPVVFDILISGQNIEMLDIMLNDLDNLKSSNDFQNDLNKVRYNLGEKLHNIYVKDKINLRKNNKDTLKFIEMKKKKYKKE